MAARQPSFMQEYRAGSMQAHQASVARGDGNTGHSAVQSWGRFTCFGMGVSMVRPLDPLASSLERRLSEVDLVECWAWWLVKHQLVNTETAWSYVSTVNAWHERACGVKLAGGMPLTRVKGMLDGLQNLLQRPVSRRLRVGVRPRQLQRGITAALQPAQSSADANAAALMECALVGVLRAGELAATRGAFNPRLQPTRADARFNWRGGRIVDVTIWVVNSKAKGAERYRKVEKHLPMRGRYCSPGLALWFLLHVADPTPAEAAATTPLFRVPATGRVLSVDQVRSTLRRCMQAIGRDGSLYGAHSMRIGGATALAWQRAPHYTIQTIGRWSSDAYLAYLRSRRSELDSYVQGIADADVDDFQNDFIGIDDFDFDAEDDM